MSWTSVADVGPTRQCRRACVNGPSMVPCCAPTSVEWPSFVLIVRLMGPSACTSALSVCTVRAAAGRASFVISIERKRGRARYYAGGQKSTSCNRSEQDVVRDSAYCAKHFWPSHLLRRHRSSGFAPAPVRAECRGADVADRTHVSSLSSGALSTKIRTSMPAHLVRLHEAQLLRV